MRALPAASCLLAACIAGALAAGPEKPKVGRASIAAMEASFDKKLAKLWTDDPFLLLGMTRGVYLDGFGAVFTAEVNLVTGPTITPFRPQISKEDILRHHQRKIERLPILRKAMRSMLMDSAASLDNVAADEQIVLGVTLTRYPWEDMTGIPTQILMQSRKRELLEAQRTGSLPDSACKVQEF